MRDAGQTYLLLVVQTLVVVFKDGHAFRLARVVLGVGVGHVAREDFLPEGEAARGTWLEELVHVFVVVWCVWFGATERLWKGSGCGGAERRLLGRQRRVVWAAWVR